MEAYYFKSSTMLCVVKDERGCLWLMNVIPPACIVPWPYSADGLERMPLVCETVTIHAFKTGRVPL